MKIFMVGIMYVWKGIRFETKLLSRFCFVFVWNIAFQTNYIYSVFISCTKWRSPCLRAALSPLMLMASMTRHGCTTFLTDECVWSAGAASCVFPLLHLASPIRNSSENFTSRIALRVWLWETRSCRAVAAWKRRSRSGWCVKVAFLPRVSTVIDNGKTECKIIFEITATFWNWFISSERV